MAISINVQNLKKTKSSATIPIVALNKTDGTLLEQHLQEWLASGVHEEIVRLNIVSLAGKEAIVQHLNLGEVNDWQLNRRYKSVFQGGWACQYRFKPDNPRFIKNKSVKYESPLDGSCDPILLRLPEHIWQAISEKYHIPKSPEIDGWDWVKQNPEIPVVVAEGEKKAGCVISQALTPCIALPGHSTAYEKDGDIRFKDFLHPRRKIRLCFDKDTSETAAKNVSRSIKGITWRIHQKQENGRAYRAQIQICQWYTHEKAIDDIWVSKGTDTVTSIIDNPICWSEWVDTSFNVLGFEADIQFDAPQWQEIELPENKHLIVLKGGKGTGKTWYLEQLSLKAKAQNCPSIASTHRIQLSQTLASRLGLTYISEIDEKVESAKNITLVIDSLTKINPENFSGGLVIIDEACQQLEHFLIGKTCEYKRQSILYTLRKLAQIIIETNGRFIIADADMNEATIKFFMGLLGEETPFIIENTYREPSYTCWLSNGAFVRIGPESWLKTPIDIIDVALHKAQMGERIFIACTGQKEESKWGSINLEALFLKNNISSVIRIDSDTVKDPQHPAFRATSKINELCDSYQVVIGTPSVGTGVSIENRIPFNLVCGIFTGVGSPDAARQFLMRIRDKKVPRLIYAADRGLNNQFISLGYSKQKVSSQIKELKEFQETCLTEHDKDWSEEYPEIKHCNTASVYFNNLIAAKNNENIAYKNFIRHGLKSENVNVIDIKSSHEFYETISDNIDLQLLFKELTELTIKNVNDYRHELKNQQLLNKEEYDKLKSATELSTADRIALEATLLSNKYGGIEVTEELAKKDSEGWYEQIKLHYACTIGYEIQKDIQALIGNSQLRKGEGVLIEHDFVNRQKLLSQVEFILGSEILNFIDSKHSFSKVDEESLNLYQDMVEQIPNINLIFNRQIKPSQYKLDKFNFQLLAQIANFIGATGDKARNLRINSQQIKHYQIVFPDDKRQDIFDKWLEHDLEKQAKWQQRKKDWEIKKLIGLCHDDMSIAEFLKLKNNTLFEDAWEQVNTKTRIGIINKTDNYALPRPCIEAVYPTNSNYLTILADIENWKEIAIDIETFGNDNKNKEGLHARRGYIRLIQISNGEKVYYADLGGRTHDRETTKQYLEKFLQLLERKIREPNVKIIGQNIHFDLRFLRLQLGFSRARNIADTMKGAQIFFGDYGGLKVLPGGYGLGNLSQKLLGLNIDKSEQKSDWGAELTQSQINYAVHDPFITYHIYKRLEELYQAPQKFGFGKLEQTNIREAWELENNVIPCAVEMELNGLSINRTEAQGILSKCKNIQTQLLEQWAILIPNLNYTQNSKVTEFLNNKYNLNIKSLNKSAIAELNHLDEIKLLSKLRAIKIPIQQIESLLRSSESTGRIQTVYNTLTGTGRFSSGNSKTFKDLPNLQSISAKAHPALEEYTLPSVRSCVKPNTLTGLGIIDLAGAHGRIAADVANDPVAIAGNNDESIDNHSKVAEYVARALGHTTTWEEIQANRKKAPYKTWRDTAKNTYYGWLNGAGAKRVQEQIKANSGQIVSIEACQAAIKGCEELYPKVVEFRKQLVEKLSSNESIITIDGKQWSINKITSVQNRILHPIKVDDDNVDLPYTQCLAAIWSRTEATALKRALCQLTELADTHPEWCLKVVNYVHDEIDLEFNLNYAETVMTTANNIIGDCFQATLNKVTDGRETDWKKLIASCWADK